MRRKSNNKSTPNIEVELIPEAKAETGMPIEGGEKEERGKMTNDKTYDIRNLHIPSVMLISLVFGVVWITWLISETKNKIDTRLERVELQLEKTISSIKEGDATNKAACDVIRDNSWTLKDHELWCYRAQVLNTSWKCPESSSIKNRSVPSQYEQRGETKFPIDIMKN